MDIRAGSRDRPGDHGRRASPRCFARGGLQVVAIEADPAALRRGLAILERSLDRAVSRGRLTAAEQVAVLGRVRPPAARRGGRR